MDRAAAEVAAASLGQASAHVLDLTDEAAIGAAHDATLAAHGRIDILVNNAGITGGNAPSWDLPVAEWKRVVEVNLIAPYLVTRAVVPGMIAAGYGRIVNIASIAGKEGNPNASHYSASKAGLIGFTKSLGKELAQDRRARELHHAGRRRDGALQADDAGRRSPGCARRFRWTAS
jgi:2-dehydro-3-deoxy-L-rhamnonate dehydrogenase (NAD+)